MIVWILTGVLANTNFFLNKVEITRVEPLAFEQAESCLETKALNEKKFKKDYKYIELSCNEVTIEK